MKKIIILFCIIGATYTHAQPPKNFSLAKKIAAEIFIQNPKTFCCGCLFNQDKQIDLASCHMQTANNIKRAHRLEWEHMLRRVGNML